MVEESLGDIPFENKSFDVDETSILDDDNSEEAEEKQEAKTSTTKDEQEKTEELGDAVTSAHRLIRVFSKRLGAAYKLDSKIALNLLEDIQSAGSGGEALQKLDQLVVLLEDMLAELNKVALLSRYKAVHEVSMSGAEIETITIFNRITEPLEDEEFHDVEQQSTKVKEGLIQYTADKYPEIMSPFPES